MSGQGKYTTYAPAASPKNTLLNRLFKGNSTETNPLQDLVGKEDDARKQVVARAQQFLTPAHQQGDLGFFPNGVNLDFSGDPNGSSPPDLTQVKWKNPGDPANAYTPDISSPGPGKTDGRDKDVDPQISVEDIKGAGYVPGAPGTSTHSPSETIPAIVKDAAVGTTPKLAFDVHGFG